MNTNDFIKEHIIVPRDINDIIIDMQKLGRNFKTPFRNKLIYTEDEEKKMKELVEELKNYRKQLIP